MLSSMRWRARIPPLNTIRLYRGLVKGGWPTQLESGQTGRRGTKLLAGASSTLVEAPLSK